MACHRTAVSSVSSLLTHALIIPIRCLLSRRRPRAIGLRRSCSAAWSPDRQYAYIEIASASRENPLGRTAAIPIPPGKSLPPIPSAAVHQAAEWAKFPGVKLVEHEQHFARTKPLGLRLHQALRARQSFSHPFAVGAAFLRLEPAPGRSPHHLIQHRLKCAIAPLLLRNSNRCKVGENAAQAGDIS
jgi:hypothetical protein